MSDSGKALELARLIFEAEQRVTELKREFEGMFTPNQPTRNGTSSVLAFDRTMRADSGPSKILNFLAARSGNEFTIGEIANGTGMDTDEVGRAAYRLYTKKKIDNTSRGVYRFPINVIAEVQEETPA